MCTTVAGAPPVPKGPLKIRESSLSAAGGPWGRVGPTRFEPYSAILYSSSKRRPTIIFWISAVPSPMSSIGASR
ncbi:hypothetical protein ABH937_001236 [Kitasatospora sp. GAS1066B]